MVYNVNFDIELKKNTYPGLYIALEGIDGSGKTTQVEKLVKYFEKEGKEVFKTHEPRRDTVVGKLIHEILIANIDTPRASLQYLFAADRAIHQEQMLLPALKDGKVVISDRCFWSAIPYGIMDKSESDKEENSNQLLTALSILSMYHEFVGPDITFVLDVSVDTAAERLEHLQKKAEIYEKKEKLEKIKEGYDFLLDKFPEGLTKIDAGKSAEQVTLDILDTIKKLQK